MNGFGIWVPGERAEAPVGVLRREVGDGLVAEDHVGEAAVEGQRADRDGQRREARGG